MVTNPDYLELAHNSVWTAFPYRDRSGKKDWAKREISHANRFLDRATELLTDGLVGVVYRLSRLAHYHANRGIYYSELESVLTDPDEDQVCDCWENARKKAEAEDRRFLKLFPSNPKPKQWNEHREHEKRLYHSWEGQMDVDCIFTDDDCEPWATDSDSWKPDGWRLS